MIATTRSAAAGVFRHEVAVRRTSWAADPTDARDAGRRAVEDRRRPAVPAAVPARSPEDEVEEYERWDGMA